jgi:hypothetical protein
MKRIFLPALLAAFGMCAAHAQDLDEVIVTGMRGEAPIPGANLKRPGDYILLNVGVSNDSREEKTRTAEIKETLRAMLDAAARDKSIELSVIGDNNLVLPLRLDSATLVLTSGPRPDTSHTTISVKTRIPAQVANSSALVAKLRDFAKGIKPVGRTEIDGDGGFVISIVNPEQYRDEVIELFATDVKKVTSALGSDYKVIARGIDQPIEWVQDGMLGVTIYVPYRYDVLPSTVTSYLQVSE